MRDVIRLNDPTSHGGQMISAAPNSVVMGVAMARQGDRVQLPAAGPRRLRDRRGDPKVLIDGVPVAFDGHSTSCGAVLMTTVPTSGRAKGRQAIG